MLFRILIGPTLALGRLHVECARRWREDGDSLALAGWALIRPVFCALVRACEVAAR